METTRMKCQFCDYETESIEEQEANQELERHYLRFHPDSCISENQFLSILEFHYKFLVEIDTIIKDFFDTRAKLSEEFKKRELKEKFTRRD